MQNEISIRVRLIELYKSNELKTYINKFSNKTDAEDVMQDLFINLFENESKFENVIDLKNYVFKSIKNNLQKKKKATIILTNEFEEKEDEIINNEIDLNCLSWFQKKLLELYAEEKSLKKIEDKTGIPKTTIHRTIKEARILIKKNIQ